MKKVLILSAALMIVLPLLTVNAEEVAPVPVSAPTPMPPTTSQPPMQQPPMLPPPPQDGQYNGSPRPMMPPPMQQPFQGGQYGDPRQMPPRGGEMQQPPMSQPPKPWGEGAKQPPMPPQRKEGKMPSQADFQQRGGPNMGGQNSGEPKPDIGNRDNAQMSTEFKAEITKKWASQMEKNISQYAKRISTYEAKKIPVSTETKNALSSLKSIIEKAKNPSEDEDFDMSEAGDLMQTLDEGTRNAEIAAQFPKVMKEVVKEITRQNSFIKKATARAPKLKIDVSSLLEAWKKDVADMVALKDEAQKTYDGGAVIDAVQLLRNDFFDISRDANEKAGTFDMISNIQQMVKGAEKDIKTFTNQIAKLKKKGTDVAELETLIAQGKAKLAEIKTVMISGDTDKMIDAVEELNGLKLDFEESYYAATGQSAYGAFGQMPSMPSLQGPASQPNPQRFNPTGDGQMPQGGGQTCNINGIEMPGACKDIEKKMNAENQGASVYGTFQRVINWFRN